ncbi:MAG: signal peptidase I [Candidatus Spechtbacterales bacterium]|nr:signal peptidase I [Candidatus Spechtbacterales bacterium]
MSFKGAFRSIIDFLSDIAKIVAISLLIIIPIRYFIVQPFFVRGASMEPSYQQGDYLLVDEISYRFSEPERGEVIVFKFPGNTSQFYIKRIIGLPGETIIIKEGEITIQNNKNPEGFVLDEPYINELMTPGDLEISLESTEYFVLGDNRDASHDSRRWGPLNERFIVGRVLLRAFPFNKFNVIDAPNY